MVQDGATWSVAKHDTVPSVDLWLPSLEAHTYLFSFLAADGEPFLPPYTKVRDKIAAIVTERKRHERPGQAPNATVENQRLRSWKSLFESFGFFYVDDQAKLRLTPLGRLIKGLYSELDLKIEGANDHLAKLAVDILSRHTLRNPLDTASYPEDSDVKPYVLIWRAMRQLDNKLHWEEMNRVLMRVVYKKDVEAAITHISDIRKATGSVYNEGNLDLLGPPVVQEDAETRRRITPWFARAGFGGLLIDTDDDGLGFRHLVDKYKPLIDQAILDEAPTPPSALTTGEAYLHYLTDLPVVDAPTPDQAEQTEIDRVISAIQRYGDRKIICLTGLPGTGKTRLAEMVAQRISEGDPYRFEEIQFHEGTTYDNFMEGFTPRPSGEGYELKPMTLRIINRRARLDPTGSAYILLVEEFTRANVHAVLGELITYIEHRDRPFRLALSQEEESIASNLIILATMNPRDRSAIVLDHAILRRLHQIPVQSSTAKLRTMLEGELDPALLDQLATWFGKYIQTLPFGHAEFADVRSAADLRDLWSGTLRYFLTDAAGEIGSQFTDLAADYPWHD
jgi:hypothetical protein